MRAYPSFLDIDLCSEQGRALLSSVEGRHGAPIVRAAPIAKRMFILRSPWAPGLRFVGGETHARSPEGDDGTEFVYSLSGAGETLEDAFASCIGEGIDRLAQIECRGDITITAGLQEVEA